MALAGGDTTSGLPMPRFVSIKTDRVNVRGGPDKDHDVAWIYTRVGWPVEITAEFENWRRIRDSDGTEGWVYHSLLSGKRMAAVQLKSKTDLAPLHAKPDADSAGDGATAIGRARIGQKLQRRCGAVSSAKATTAGSSRTGCGASIRTRRSSRRDHRDGADRHTAAAHIPPAQRSAMVIALQTGNVPSHYVRCIARTSGEAAIALASLRTA